MEINEPNLNAHLPYAKLEKIGINRQTAELLPQEFKRKLIAGEITPFIQISLNVENGRNLDKLNLPVKLQLVSDKNGNDVLLAYPAYREFDMARHKEYSLSPFEVEQLLKGEVLHREIEVNGEKCHRFLQLDPETNSIMSIRLNEIKLEQRLHDMEMINDIQLGTQQKQQAREGKPIELDVGGEKVTVGVDLKEQQGFKVMSGDMKEWERQKQMEYDDAHPEYVGLVLTDKNRWEYQQVVKHDEQNRAIKVPERGQRQKASQKI